MTGKGAVQDHYDTLLARHYAWMMGGWDRTIAQYHRFFSDHAIRPAGNGIAVDLGAGCGFGSLALAGAGFRVISVDLSQTMLDILEQVATNLPVTTVHSDILDFMAGCRDEPELIACLGDTLTHLPDTGSVKRLVHQCSRTLNKGGTFIISFRDSSKEPAGSTAVIPVQRDADRIFFCRLDYHDDRIRVTDILYTRESGRWERVSGTYPKLRISPHVVSGMLVREGFQVRTRTVHDGMVTLIGKKGPERPAGCYNQPVMRPRP